MRVEAGDRRRHEHPRLRAQREDAPFHEAAYLRIQELADGRSAWAIPWPCVHEFLAVVTHARIFAPPTPIAAAVDQVEAWLESPTRALLAEADGYWSPYRELLEVGRVSGPQIHDARIAALCRHHGIAQLWSADRDFGRFPGLVVVNPLVA